MFCKLSVDKRLNIFAFFGEVKTKGNHLGNKHIRLLNKAKPRLKSVVKRLRTCSDHPINFSDIKCHVRKRLVALRKNAILAKNEVEGKLIDENPRSHKGERMYYSTTYSSPIGRITLASNGDNLVGLWMECQKYFGDTVSEEMAEKPNLAVFKNTKRWLEHYFKGKRPAVSDLSLAPNGGKFRQAVWDILCEIPYGEVVTYGEIAQKMAARMGKTSMSSQAVGGAVGHNPISIIIPCHRVVGANGSLTGYAGGIEKKIRLLGWEGVDMSRLFVPKKSTAP